MPELVDENLILKKIKYNQEYLIEEPKFCDLEIGKGVISYKTQTNVEEEKCGNQDSYKKN